MGIKDIRQIIDMVAYVPYQAKLSKFTGKRMAVDISCFLYKYVRSMGEERWIDGIIRLLSLLKKYGIYVVCVFDGKDAPIEKNQTKEDRKATTQSVKNKIEELEEIMEKVYVQYYGTEIEMPDDLVANIKYIFNRQRTIKEDPNRPLNFKDSIAMYRILTQIHSSWKKQTIDVVPEHIQMVRELVPIMGFSMIQAKGEAETVCAYLWKKGIVDIVFSEDSDILAYGVVHSISKLDSTKEEVIYIHAPTLYRELNLTYEQFKDLCIMCGCDYNKRIPNYGPKKSYNLILEYGSIDDIENATMLDVSNLNYERCRELLTIPSYIEEKVIRPENHKLNKEMLKDFLKKYNCNVKSQTIEKYWQPIKITVMCSPRNSFEENKEESSEENEE